MKEEICGNCCNLEFAAEGMVHCRLENQVTDFYELAFTQWNNHWCRFWKRYIDDGTTNRTD